MLRHPKPRLVFLFAIILLLLSGVATGVTVHRLYEGERWVRHSFELEVTVGAIESTLSKAGRSRSAFVDGDAQALVEFDDARKAAFSNLSRLRSLTADSQEQRNRCDRLQAAIEGRLGVLEKFIQLAKSHSLDAHIQQELTAELLSWASQTAALSDEMKQAEEALLGRRNQITATLFRLIVSILSFTFLLSVYLIWKHYRMLTGELRQRSRAERDAQCLSLQLLRAQDEERRKISRELHDGLGQSMAAAKIIADSFLTRVPDKEVATELVTILEDALTGVRTMSYLLHPPLLDEIGLASAVEWFIEGFSKRTGIIVTCGIIGDKRRLPPAAELTLFRILQESLTNIQRHARSPSAEVRLDFADDRVSMSVQDQGVGIPAETWERFQVDGTQVGVGLAGMRQRIQEQSGTFSLSSGSHGTTIIVQLPIPPDVEGCPRRGAELFSGT
jgi:signal transduction histidine kinase